ncbi:MAG: hypothetical protein P9F19_03975 [Candidatus Contendobacter sp.]|nr:hypothetical protein [Candidatus Contendobacter sp.]MDG4556542.1 hypothetical protein [Candidatus Contendobacter sp.]
MNSKSPCSVAPPPPFPNPARRQVIAADHPSLKGHFPGHPIVPGVVILEEVIQAFEDWRPESRVVGMPVVKFLAPLRPGQPFVIRFAESGVRGVRFECVRDDGRAVAQGCLTMACDEN